MQNHRNFQDWRKSFNLCTFVYQELVSFLADKKFGLASQIKSRTVSIASNRAEGAGRNDTYDFKRFLNITC